MVDRGIGVCNLATCLAWMALLTAGLLARWFAQAADPLRLLQPIAGRWFAAVAAVQTETTLQFRHTSQKHLSLADKKRILHIQMLDERL
jgi:hypothetical protein